MSDCLSSMLDDFSHELESTQSRLDNVMKKLAKVSHMTSGMYVLKAPEFLILETQSRGCLMGALVQILLQIFVRRWGQEMED